MSETEYRELLEYALREVKRLRQEREERTQASTEPIAVIGMACRFPGADSPDELWRVSRDGVDCTDDIPTDRWRAEDYYHPDPDQPGKMVTRRAGFLKDVRGFDAAFFGISPREARSMDPQQRILLEVTWEAFERAAIPPTTLYNSPVGVFLGLANLEYANLIRQAGGIEWIDSHFGTGNSASVASGRLAYHFGFRGPALTVDTACSSSLVAIHLAVASLRRHECNLAIAAGVNVMILPETFTHFSNARMLARDGRCKPFSAQADGYGRAEGCGVVILKRLRDAIQDRDPISAVVLGSASNHDGRSAGLTAPNGPAQEAVIHAALIDAGLQPRDVQLVEAHGTGTPLGDPIEAGALARVYGSARTELDALHVATIKANIGHAEAAAGIAGFIHACQCVQHRQVPPLLHMIQRSSHIPWATLNFPSTGAELVSNGSGVIAAVSSFGFSGTNAHVILQGYKCDPMEGQVLGHTLDANAGGQHVFMLSAKTETALRYLIERYIQWIEEHPDVKLADICNTLRVGRTPWDFRFEAVATSHQDLLLALRNYPQNSMRPNHLDRESSSVSEGTPEYAQHGPAIRLSSLPTYPFQHQAYWVPDTVVHSQQSSPKTAQMRQAKETCVLTTAEWRDLGEHRVFGQAVMPAVGWLELVSRALRVAVGKEFEIRSIAFEKMLTWGDQREPQLEVSIAEQKQNDFQFYISAGDQAQGSDMPPPTYVQGHVVAAVHRGWQGGSLEIQRERFQVKSSTEKLYQQFSMQGLDYGPLFQRVEALWHHSTEALGALAPKRSLTHGSEFVLRLGALDSALHVVAAAAINGLFHANDASAFVPVSVESVQWYDFESLPRWSMARVRKARDGYAIEGDVFVWGEHGQPLVQWLSVRFEGFSSDPRQLPDDSSKDEMRSQNDQERTVASLAGQLLALPVSMRPSVLQKYLQVQLAQELEVPLEVLLPEQSLAAIGLDSLMIFRLGIRLETELGFAIDSRAMMRGVSLLELTASLLETLESLPHTDDLTRV